METAVISIITGIIVFILTWPINNYLNKKTNKKEWRENIEKANTDMIEVLKDYIISFSTISIEIIDEIRIAQVTQYSVNDKDLYNLKQIKAILIKDFIGIKLIADSQRKMILELIENNIDLQNKEILHDNEEKILEYNFIEKKRKETQLITTMMTTIVALVTMMTVTLTVTNTIYDNSYRIEFPIIVVTLLMTVFLVEIALIFTIKIKKVSKKYQEIENKDEEL